MEQEGYVPLPPVGIIGSSAAHDKMIIYFEVEFAISAFYHRHRRHHPLHIGQDFASWRRGDKLQRPGTTSNRTAKRRGTPTGNALFMPRREPRKSGNQWTPGLKKAWRPNQRSSSTPNRSGERAPPAVLRPQARPNPPRRRRAAWARWLKVAPIKVVGTKRITADRATSPAIEVKNLLPGHAGCLHRWIRRTRGKSLLSDRQLTRPGEDKSKSAQA